MKITSFFKCIQYFKPAPTIVIAKESVKDIDILMSWAGIKLLDANDLLDKKKFSNKIWRQEPFYIKISPENKETFYKDYFNDDPALVSRMAIFKID